MPDIFEMPRQVKEWSARVQALGTRSSGQMDLYYNQAIWQGGVSLLHQNVSNRRTGNLDIGKANPDDKTLSSYFILQSLTSAVTFQIVTAQPPLKADAFGNRWDKKIFGDKIEVLINSLPSIHINLLSWAGYFIFPWTLKNWN